jgi:hypothetical protein
MRKFFVLAAIVALLVLGKRWLSGDSPLSLVTLNVTNPYPASSPFHEASQRFVDGVNADPKLKARFAGTFTQRGLYSEINTALHRGARSLDGPVLVGAMSAMDRALPHLDTHSCAQAFRERDTFDKELSERMKEAFEQISPIYHASLMRFYLEALTAEVHDAPERSIDKDALRSALNNLGETFQGEFAQRFMAAMGDRQHASDEDLCWAGTTLLHGVTQMGDHDREVLSRWALGGK